MEVAFCVFMVGVGFGAIVGGIATAVMVWNEVRARRDTHVEQMFAIALDALCRERDGDEGDIIEEP